MGMLHHNCLSHQYLQVKENSEHSVKNKVCRSCIVAGHSRDIFLPFPQYFLDDYLSAKDQVQIDRILKEYDLRKNFQTRVNNISIGNFAMYETILRFKLIDPDLALNDLIEPYYRSTLKNCLLIHYALNEFLDSNSFDSLVVYNPLYSFNQTIFEITKQRNIGFVSIQSSTNSKKPYSRVIISGGNSPIQEIVKKWGNGAEDVLKYKTRKFAQSYLRHLKKGRQPWHYSQVKTKKQDEFKLDLIKKIAKHKKIVVCPLSSSDEVNAYEVAFAKQNEEKQRPYSSQEGFLRDIVQFARLNAELHFVIRMHPRMSPNKRETLQSTEGLRLKHLLDELSESTPNITVDDGQSLAMHDLLKVSDLVVNFMSSVGLDAMLLGIPTLSIYQGDSLSSYPVNLSAVVFQPEELPGKILHMIDSKVLSVRQARQWLYFLMKTETSRIPTFTNSPTLLLWRLLTFKFKRMKRGPILLFLINAVRRIELRTYRIFGLYGGLRDKFFETADPHDSNSI
jgi:hypothetical protein